jgi:hypothetical protein
MEAATRLTLGQRHNRLPGRVLALGVISPRPDSRRPRALEYVSAECPGLRLDSRGRSDQEYRPSPARVPPKSLVSLWHTAMGQSPGMHEPPELQHNRHWRMAVWSLRVGYVGLAIGVAGLIARSTGSNPWILAVGVIIWLAAAAVTLVGFLWSRQELPEPRPGYWPMRFMLIHDTVRPRSPAERP